MIFIKAARLAAMTGAVTIGLSACVINVSDDAPDRGDAVPPLPTPMTCNAEKAKYHVGHDATQAMGGAILKDSGARSLRWGPPGGAWSMDYREDRVNVRYDGNMKITEVTCG